MIQENSDDNAKDVEKLTMSQRKAVKVLKATWKSLGLYHDEEDLKGKQYGKVVWSHNEATVKRKSQCFMLQKY